MKTRAGSAAAHLRRLPLLRPWDGRGDVLHLLFGVLREAVGYGDVGRLVVSGVQLSGRGWFSDSSVVGNEVIEIGI